MNQTRPPTMHESGEEGHSSRPQKGENKMLCLQSGGQNGDNLRMGAEGGCKGRRGMQTPTQNGGRSRGRFGRLVLKVNEIRVYWAKKHVGHLAATKISRRHQKNSRGPGVRHGGRGGSS